MTTVFPTRNHSDDAGLAVDDQQQTRQNRQIYSEIFSDENIDLSVSESLPNTDVDFDFGKILKCAVNNMTEGTHLRHISNIQFNLKYPCSICCKNVNKNQKAIFCFICQKWVQKMQ